MDSILDTIFGNSLYLMMIILIGFIGIAVAGWYFFGQSLRSLLKGSDKCPALILKKGPNLEQKHLEIDDDHYLVDWKNRKAWFLMGIQRSPTGRLAGVVLTDDSCIPQVPGVEMDLDNLCKKIKENHPYVELGRCQLEIEKAQRETQNAPLANWFGIMGLAVILGILVIGAIILFTSDFMPWAK